MLALTLALAADIRFDSTRLDSNRIESSRPSSRCIIPCWNWVHLPYHAIPLLPSSTPPPLHPCPPRSARFPRLARKVRARGQGHKGGSILGIAP